MCDSIYLCFLHSICLVAQLLEEVIDSILMFTKVPHPVSSLSVLSKGQGCIALYEEDQQWYRGVIENINTDYAEVHMHTCTCIYWYTNVLYTLCIIILFFLGSIHRFWKRGSMPST